MRINAFKLVLIYLLLCLLWFVLNSGFVFAFRNVLTENLVEKIILIRPYCFILINCLVIFKLIKLNNKKINKRETDYQNLYMSNPNPLWICDAENFKFISINEASVIKYGYSEEEFLQMTIFDILLKDDRLTAKESISKIINSDFISQTWRLSKKDDTLIYANVTFHKIRFQHKNAIMVLAADVTEQVKYEQNLKQINQTLEEEKLKLKATEQLAKVSGWEFYFEDNLLIWSDELYEIFGFDRKKDEVNYVQLLKSIHQEDLSNYNFAVENLLKYGQDLDISYRFVTKFGEIKYVKVLGKLCYQNGKAFKAQGTMQDITELKLIQQEKNNYLQRLNNTLENITDGYYLLNRNWIIAQVNFNCEKLFGIKKEDMENHHYLELFPEHQNLKFYAAYKKVFDEGAFVNFEEYLPRLKKWFCVNAYPTDEGAAIYFSDITESKEKDFHLKQALDRYDLVAKATNDVIYDWDVITDQTEFGHNINDLLGLDKNATPDFNMQWWMDNVHPDDLNRIVESYKEILEKKLKKRVVEYRLKTSNGSYKYIFDQGYLIYDENQNFVRMIGALKDIDQLKRVNNENRQLADIITKVNNMIVVQDASNGISWVNEAFEKFTGYTLNDVKGKLPHQVLSGPETDIDITNRILEGKRNFERFAYEIINYTKHQHKYWVNIEFTPIFTSEGKPDGYICIHSDITARKEKEEKIGKQNEILRNIAWMSSHELRRPVASILGLIELIKETDNEPDRDESIKMLYTCTKHLDEIVHKINHSIEAEINDI